MRKVSYIERIFQISPKSGYISLDWDDFMNPYSLKAAPRAAGAGVKAVDLVFQKKVMAAFCNVRPPGHHAERAKAMGFCIFNNVAIAAAHAMAKYNIKRLAIIDFDVHHGNGTEEIFRNDARVLFCSTFEHPFYPFSEVDNTSNHMLPIPLKAFTDGTIYREKVSALWFDKIKSFSPEVIFFSAGFDAHRCDPLGDLQLEVADYLWLIQQIADLAKKFCSGRMISMLEGGYNLDYLGDCVVAHIQGLL